MVRRRFYSLVIVAVVGWLMISTAWAHRDRGPNDPCRKEIGNSLLHLTLYQPHFDPDAEYCEEVPRAGKTIVVVDVTVGELRQVPISVEMVANGSAGASRSILSLPGQLLERGVVDAEVVLEEGNSYVAQVTVDMGAGKESHTFSFPILVFPWYTALIKPALMLFGVLIIMAISVMRYRITSQKQEESSVGKRKIRRVAN